jgi:hypothetical protein
MDIYTPAITGALQLPLYSTDPAVTFSGDIWFSTSGTGSLKYATESGSVVITRTLNN